MSKEKIYYFYTLRSEDFPEEIRYVGVTTETLKQRFSEHKYKATSEKYRSQPVHKWMYSKFKQNIDVQICYLDECDSSMWQEREKYWIKFYKDVGAKLLNLQLGGNGVITKEMRNTYGRTRSILAHQIPVAAYDKITGKEFMRFDSITFAAKYFNVQKSAIQYALTNEKYSSCGYKWKKLPKIEDTPKNVHKNKHYNDRIEVYQFDLNGKYIKKYLSVRQLYREFLGQEKNSGSNFIKKILNSNKIWHGYIWCTKDFKIDYCKVFPYVVIDSEGNILQKFTTRTDISKYLNIDLTTVNKYLSSKKPLKFKNNIQIIKH